MSRKSKICFGKISSNFPSNAVNTEPTGGFGTFGPPKPIDDDVEDDGREETEKLQNVMGIGEFGRKARRFDVTEMVNQVKATARELQKSKLKEEPSVSNSSSSSSGSEDDESEDDDEFIGPPIPPEVKEASGSVEVTKETVVKKVEKDNSDSSDISDDEEDEESYKLFIPHTFDATMVHGSKAVTAISLDHSGARMATGSVDYDVSFWDFAGMDSNMRSFRTLQPAENYPIRALHYSSTGDLLLVISGATQAKVLDRDGFEKLETVKGDMYITDQAKTKGHTAGLLAGGWSPAQKDQFLTTSADGTVRFWNFHGGGARHTTIFKCRAQNGLKVSPSAVDFSRDGRVVVCGCGDGSIQLWDVCKSTISPIAQVRKAHQQQNDISSVRYSHTGNQLLTRGCDSFMKLWDVRRLKDAIHQVGDLFSRYDNTDAIFSPNDAIVATGTSLQRGETTGYVHFFDSLSFTQIKRVPAGKSHIIKLYWHQKLNQIFVGTGCGTIKCFYDTKRSLRGVTLCALKSHKKAQSSQGATSATLQVITPHALPLFRQERRKTNKKLMEKARLDPMKSRRPDLPITSGQGGRVVSSGGTLSSYVIRNLGLSKRVEDDQDPREAILKYAKEAEENPYWIAPAYAKTQPKPKFSEEISRGQDEDEPLIKKSKPD